MPRATIVRLVEAASMAAFLVIFVVALNYGMIDSWPKGLTFVSAYLVGTIFGAAR